MSLRTADLEFELPPDLIARRPVEPRDACRLLVVSRSDQSRLEHRVFRELPSLLNPGDLLLTNVSRVVPARLAGARADTGARVEGLFVAEPEPGVWTVLLKANTKLVPGHTVLLHTRAAEPSPWRLELLARDGDGWRARVRSTLDDPARPFAAPAILARIGATPLPPYILAARKSAPGDYTDDLDRAWYQTVYADDAQARSIAAPTAGLHFTPELLSTLADRDIRSAPVTLHVGIGTFKPIDTDLVAEHPIHAEHAEVPAPTLADLRAARERGSRIIAVGTTSVRAVESLPHPIPPAVEHHGFIDETRLFIQPGFTPRWTDALITNFHLPRSTLLALVGALFPGGVDRVKAIYREAIAREYRFFSYGDAMLILP